MRIYVSKENIHDIEVPHLGHLSLHPGRFYDSPFWSGHARSVEELDNDQKFYPLEIDDEIFNHVCDLTARHDNKIRYFSEEAEKTSNAAIEASTPLIQKLVETMQR